MGEGGFPDRNVNICRKCFYGIRISQQPMKPIQLFILDLFKAINFKTFSFFLNVGPPKEDVFSGHLLCPIFQSTLV